MNYSIRVSPRAKHVRLKMSPQDGLVVIVPRGYKQTLIPGLLERHRSWIEKAQRKVDEQRRLLLYKSSDILPEQVSLKAIDEEWFIEYRRTASERITVTEHHEDTIVLSGAVDDRELCLAALRRWINRKANKHLIPWFESLSREIWIKYRGVTIRNQRTRWGSCSTDRTISLNQKLLLIPAPLIRYVMIHELCHVVHHDHSPRFWMLVDQYQPDCRSLDKQLRPVWKNIPSWVH